MGTIEALETDDTGATRKPDTAAQATRALDAALAWLRGRQHDQGYWVAPAETNSTIEAEWLLASHILGVELPIEDGVIRALLQRQRDDGSWEIYPDAPAGDINATVEVYAALRARGLAAERPELVRARQWILAHGGLRDVRVFTRYWLAMIGVWPWRETPDLPPELIWFPLWFPFNIHNFAQWARATMIPLAVVCARSPVWPLPDGSRLEELFADGSDNFEFSMPAKNTSLLSLESLFEACDRVLHKAKRARLIPFRETAIKLCLEWMLRHQDSDGAWGGIQPPWIYGLIALRNEGYALDHPALAKGLAALSGHWSYERDGATHIQATDSIVWDTLFCVLAMSEAGHTVAADPGLYRAVQWLLDQQVRVPGDWSQQTPGLIPGGWAFERANNYYPDLDDTALALLVFARVRPDSGALAADIDAAVERGVAWTLGMQSDNGGWGAFDRNNNKKIISKIPFCNFGEALDPPSADVTAHIVEALGALGYPEGHPALARALAFIRAEQESDGSWFGRWGVNHIYGVGAVLPALRAVDQDMGASDVQRAAAWLVAKQNDDGGWGEHCASYMDAAYKGVGASTPSQTGWALMALLAVGDEALTPAIERGLSYLTRTQTADGTWAERAYTATGFPGYGVGERISLDDPELQNKLAQGPELSRGFMISFNMYRHYFPMLALARRCRRGPAAAARSAARGPTPGRPLD